MTETPDAPPITEQMREQARQTPGTWLYIVDPGYQDTGEEVPPEGVMAPTGSMSTARSTRTSSTTTSTSPRT